MENVTCMGRLPIITNTQKYSIHDGPGIRTTVFFKGCPLRCSWCHNPETQAFTPELIWYEDKCTGCGACVTACTKNAISILDGKPTVDQALCQKCGACTNVCLHSAREVFDHSEPVSALVQKLVRDQMFYEESGGGVTLSGGEAMCQDITYLEALAKQLKRKGISVVVDTCGYASYDRFERINPYVDAYLYDIKTMDPEVHKQHMGYDNQLILENLCKLSRDGKEIYIRLPLIAGLNDSKEDIKAVLTFLKEHDIMPKKLHLLPYHDIGKDKYKRLSRMYEGESFEAPTKEQLESLLSLCKEQGFHQCQIGG